MDNPVSTGTAPVQPSPAQPPPTAADAVVIRFVGDSGDGMQLIGSEFSTLMGRAGFDFATQPDYPPEINAPAGSPFGVSGFQVKLAASDALTSGDRADILVVMNPAALRTALADVRPGALLIVNSGGFTPANLDKAGYASNPLIDASLDAYALLSVDMSGLTAEALGNCGLGRKDAVRCKNHFALGLVLALFGQGVEDASEDIRQRFGSTNPQTADANIVALRAGHAHAASAEPPAPGYRIRRAPPAPGRYRSLTGNQALALGFVAAAERCGVPLFLGSYPITPATDILHELSLLKHFDVTTFQAEDEIGGICSAIGAAYGGALALTTTSGPGMALKTEAIGLAVMLELPLVIVNVQRGGPSTGLPTKLEQSDLLQAVHGRNGECPLPVIAARSPTDCFDCAIEALRLATTYMTPVILLSDGGIAHSATPWRVPEAEDIPRLDVRFHTDTERFMPYARDDKLARPWVRPGTPGLEHRIGGLEKDFLTGNISHVPANHQRMVETRAAKVAGIAGDLPPTQIDGPASGALLIVSWGGTYGAVSQARAAAAQAGKPVAHVHLRHLNPLPRDLGEILGHYRTVLVPELNLGQLSHLLRAAYLREVVPLCKIQGKPFMVAELLDRILELA